MGRGYCGEVTGFVANTNYIDTTKSPGSAENDAEVVHRA